jgi:hypothetical protein
MSFKLIAKHETRNPIEPKFKGDIKYRICKFVMESRQPRSIQDVAEHLSLPESETLEYMDYLTKQPHWVGLARESAHIRFVSRDGIDGYVFERDKPAA